MSSGANRRAALAALDRGRSALSQLDPTRPAETRREAIRTSWSATEVALRALLGGSPLAGKPLVGALREKGMLTLEQAHALIDFAAARERSEGDGYAPTEEDATASRAGFRTLDDALNEAAAIEARPMDDPGPPLAAGAAGTGTREASEGAPRVRRSSAWILAAIVFLLVVLPAAGWWYWTTRGSLPARISSAAELYQGGDRLAARSAFEDIARDRPDEVLPHVYLARIARDDGDMATANRELQAALRIGPSHPVALREMGSYLLANDEPDLARRFYVRALSADATDRSAMGYLGCALYRLGRMQEAEGWIRRAGPGEWSLCVQPGALPSP